MRGSGQTPGTQAGEEVEAVAGEVAAAGEVVVIGGPGISVPGHGLGVALRDICV